MTVALSDPNVTSYAYKASLVGSAHRFALTDGGLSFQVGRKTGVWRYDYIAAIRLSYRPVSMQSRRFRADITNRSGERIGILSTSWQTVALMAPQDEGYRSFITVLHRRMADAGSTAALTGGLRPAIYTGAAILLALVALAMAALLARAVASGQWPGVLFLLGFGCLFAWQTGGFVLRNKPRIYSFDDLPKELLP